MIEVADAQERSHARLHAHEIGQVGQLQSELCGTGGEQRLNAQLPAARPAVLDVVEDRLQTVNRHFPDKDMAHDVHEGRHGVLALIFEVQKVQAPHARHRSPRECLALVHLAGASRQSSSACSRCAEAR